MKFSSPNRIKPRRTGAPAFTLAEMLIAVGVFSLVIAAMCATQIFGLRVYTLAATKLTATWGCRTALAQIRAQVQQAKLVDIGTCVSNGGPASFNSLGLTNIQVGNAMRISLTNNWTNGYVIFWQDATLATTNYLKESSVTNIGSSTNLTYLSTNILTTYITNSDIFTAQDYNNNTLTNESQNDNQLQSIPNRLIVYVKLQFYQWEYPIAVVGSNGTWNAYDYYQLRTKITRRAWN
ncbi:MAG: type II secretion system protein J [Limisphaerales bacterium]